MRVFGILWLALPSLVVMTGLAIVTFAKSCEASALRAESPPGIERVLPSRGDEGVSQRT